MALITDAMTALGLAVDVIQAHRVYAPPGKLVVGRATCWVGREIKQSEHDLDLVRLDACDSIEPGQFIVIGTEDDIDVAFFGDVSALIAQTAGAVGVLVDGMVRDIAGIRSLEFPTWSRGRCPLDAFGMWAITDYNVQMCTIYGGTATVHQGEYVLADEDGVTFVAPEQAGSVIKEARKRQEQEEFVRKMIAGPKPALLEIYEQIGRW